MFRFFIVQKFRENKFTPTAALYPSSENIDSGVYILAISPPPHMVGEIFLNWKTEDFVGKLHKKRRKKG